MNQHKSTFILCWEIFSYRKLPFGLKNVGETTMDYVFHDIRHNVQAYLDNILAHSKKRTQYLLHLCAIFLRCRFYNICLNLQKCIFFIESGCLLGFIVSKHEIRVDPDKVEEITQFPEPQSIFKVQHLQGKANVLR